MDQVIINDNFFCDYPGLFMLYQEINKVRQYRSLFFWVLMLNVYLDFWIYLLSLILCKGEERNYEMGKNI
jgi:hypothetical protein